jgi:transcriptional regulator with XRE-family HTH domain
MGQRARRGDAAAIQRTFGRNVREMREAADMTRTQLAELSGISRPYIYQIERGAANARLQTIARLGSVFGVSIIDLLTRETC